LIGINVKKHMIYLTKLPLIYIFQFWKKWWSNTGIANTECTHLEENALHI